MTVFSSSLGEACSSAGWGAVPMIRRLPVLSQGQQSDFTIEPLSEAL